MVRANDASSNLCLAGGVSDVVDSASAGFGCRRSRVTKRQTGLVKSGYGDQLGAAMTVKDVPGLKDEIRTIPGWAYAVAAIVLVLMPICLFTFTTIWSPESDAPMPFRILITVFPGTALA